MNRELDRNFTQEQDTEAAHRAYEFELQIRLKADEMFVLTSELRYLLDLHANERKVLEARRMLTMVRGNGGITRTTG